MPPKGILNGTRFNVGDRIRYHCVTGYILDGHSQLTCITNTAGMAVWDFPVPICRGESLGQGWAEFVCVYSLAVFALLDPP